MTEQKKVDSEQESDIEMLVKLQNSEIALKKILAKNEDTKIDELEIEDEFISRSYIQKRMRAEGAYLRRKAESKNK